MATPSRASFIMTNMALRPRLGFADEIAARAVVIHDAGRVGVNAHLVLDGAAENAVARSPSEPFGPASNFGTMNSERPLTPAGAPSMRASTRWTMFSARSCSPAVMKIFWPVME